MKNIGLISLLVIIAAGCKSNGPYWRSRGHDLADIVTLTVGVGAGAKVMVGPFHVGLLGCGDVYGIRDGVIIPHNMEDSSDIDDFIFPLGPIAPAILRNPPIFGFSALPCRTCDQGMMTHCFPLFSLPEPNFHEGKPAWCGGEGPFYKPVLIHNNEHALQYLTQIEVVGGLVGTVRVGVNPGELVDFIVGIADRDIYGDDNVKKDNDNETAEKTGH